MSEKDALRTMVKRLGPLVKPLPLPPPPPPPKEGE